MTCNQGICEFKVFAGSRFVGVIHSTNVSTALVENYAILSKKDIFLNTMEITVQRRRV